MVKTTTALRIELEDLKNQFFELNKNLSRERTRIVQVLLNNLPEENLNKKVNFQGIDCCGNYRSWDASWNGRTLKEFLELVIDP